MKMMKNKKGSLFFGVAIGLFLYVVGVMFMPFIIDDVDTFRVNMDCSNNTISDGSKITCLYGDVLIPYLIWFFVSIAIGYIAGATNG